MEMMNALLGLKYYRIKFLTPEGPYEGTIVRISPEIQLISTKQTVWLTDNSNLGCLNFSAHEILSFEVIRKTDPPKEYEQRNNYLFEKERPTLFDDELEDSFSEIDSELMAAWEEEETHEKEFLFNFPPALKHLLPLDNVIIDKFDSDFDYAIKHFLKQDVIGLSVESPSLERHQNIHWLCISTDCCTFLFDIKTLGDSAFLKGIQGILEDDKIEKVVHDCRVMSDCLLHTYKTKLVNVFDTQAADFIVNQQRRRDGRVGPYVNPLNSLLSHYLDIPEEFLFRPKNRSHYDAVVFYGLRPLGEDLRGLFTHNVIYLRRLRQELDSLLMEPFEKCVQEYLRAYRCKTDRELALESFDLSIVPEDMLHKQIKVFNFKKHVDMPDVVHSGAPYREICNPFKDYPSFRINSRNLS